jgi:hypothetical protein
MTRKQLYLRPSVSPLLVDEVQTRTAYVVLGTIRLRRKVQLMEAHCAG